MVRGRYVSCVLFASIASIVYHALTLCSFFALSPAHGRAWPLLTSDNNGEEPSIVYHIMLYISSHTLSSIKILLTFETTDMLRNRILTYKNKSKEHTNTLLPVCRRVWSSVNAMSVTSVHRKLRHRKRRDAVSVGKPKS